MKSSIISILEFQKRFSTDSKCLKYLFEVKYGEGKIMCPSCKTEQSFFKVKSRKCYSCSNCRHQIHPLANTVFHKSSTSLRKWFYAMYLFSTSKKGVSAKELERQLQVTYKTAWRIAKQVRELFADDGKPLSGIVEVDETYDGGKNKNRHNSKKIETIGAQCNDKTPIVGILQRPNKVRAKVVNEVARYTVAPLIKENIKLGIRVMTDEHPIYKRNCMDGYTHETINHAKGEYVNGDKTTNSIEGFWSQLKRSINGTYHFVSPKYLQTYVDEVSWRYNHRLSSSHQFERMMKQT